ncbi:restriction endonuclease subunit S, partial [Galliscardovia ingluviei]
LRQRKLELLQQLKKAMLQQMFPDKGENTPQVRFQGFNDTWEQRKLGEVTSQLTKSIYPQDTPKQMYIEYSMPAYDNGKHPYHSLGSTMSSSRKVLDRPCVLINKLNVRKKRVWLVVAPAKNSVSSAEFVPLASEQIDLSFLSYLTTSSRFTSYLLNSSSGSSNSQKRVTPEVVTDYLAALPCKAEQQQISVFFQQLDNLITLHTSDLDRLARLKKFLLQTMFV